MDGTQYNRVQGLAHLKLLAIGDISKLIAQPHDVSNSLPPSPFVCSCFFVGNSSQLLCLMLLAALSSLLRRRNERLACKRSTFTLSVPLANPDSKSKPSNIKKGVVLTIPWGKASDKPSDVHGNLRGSYRHRAPSRTCGSQCTPPSTECNRQIKQPAQE